MKKIVNSREELIKYEEDDIYNNEIMHSEIKII